jgi:hypothetical protein
LRAYYERMVNALSAHDRTLTVKLIRELRRRAE